MLELMHVGIHALMITPSLLGAREDFFLLVDSFHKNYVSSFIKKS
jgi:hypothetical protein